MLVTLRSIDILTQEFLRTFAVLAEISSLALFVDQKARNTKPTQLKSTVVCSEATPVGLARPYQHSATLTDTIRIEIKVQRIRKTRRSYMRKIYD